MAKKDNMTVVGLNGATAISQMIEQLATYKIDGYVVDTDRPDGKATNSNILEYQAKQGRDITPNDDDVKKMAQDFSDEYMKKMQLEARKFNAKDRATGGRNKGQVSTEKAAKQGVASGLRKVLKFWSKLMLKRIKSQTSNSGGGLLKVGDKYAARREKKWGVNKSYVLRASGQLLKSIQNGKIQINIKKK